MVNAQPHYVGQNHDDGAEVYARFMERNRNLEFRENDRSPWNLGGMLIWNPGARWGAHGQAQRWGDFGHGLDLGLDHLEWLYDRNVLRWVLTSLPNARLENLGDSIRRLQTELDRVNAEHRTTGPGRQDPDEELRLYVGADGTSWRRPNYPLLVVSSNLVPLEL